MAGEGKRFWNRGYTFPKPLIPIQNMNGDPMIKVVVENLRLDANYIYICREEHANKYNIESTLKLITPLYKFLTIDYLTEGSVCTCLLAEKYINNETPLLLADCDHFPIWNEKDFIEFTTSDIDGITVTFPNSHPKFSYVKIDENKNVIEIREKDVISNLANVGIYYWKRGSDYVKYAKKMISKNLRVNNEFYNAPVFNEAIKDKKKIRIYQIDKQWELGTPEDLEYFISNYRPQLKVR